MKKQKYLLRSIVAFIFAILTVLPFVGYFFGLVSVILAIDSLVHLRKDKTRRGKRLSIVALLITIFIVVTKVTFFLVSLFSGIVQSVTEFSQLSYEEAFEKCEEQEEEMQVTCYTGLLILHANDTRVTSGETCYNIELNDARITCFSFVAALTNNTKMCNELEMEENPQETLDLRNYCFAVITKKGSYCDFIVNLATKLRCKSDIVKRDMEKFIYPI